MAEIGQTIKWEADKALNRLLFDCTIEVEKHSSLKNSKVISYKWTRKASGRARKIPFLRTEDKTKRAQEFLLLSLQNRARQLLLNKPIGTAVRAVWELQLTNFYTKNGTVNRRAGDITNLIQGCEDALTKANIIEDDSLICSMEAVKKASPDGINRISIKLFTYQEL